MDLINGGSARYVIRFKSNSIAPSALMSGLSFLLLMTYYFGVVDFGRLDGMEALFGMVLPLLISAAFMFMLRGMRYPAVPVYGIMGCVLCLVMIIRACLSGGTVNIVIAFVWYILTILICLGTTFSFLSNKYLMAAAFMIAAVCRLVFVDLFGHLLKLDILGSLPSIAVSFSLLSFGIFALTLDLQKPKQK